MGSHDEQHCLAQACLWLHMLQSAFMQTHALATPAHMHTRLHRVLIQAISVVHHCCSSLRGGAGVLPIDRLTDVRSPVEVVAQRIPRALLEKACGLRLPSPAMHEPQDRWVPAFPGLANMTGASLATIVKDASLY